MKISDLIRSPTYKKKDISYHKNLTIEVSFPKMKYSREDIISLSKEFLNLNPKVNSSNYLYSVAILCDDGWRSGYFAKIGEPVSLYSRSMYEGNWEDEEFYNNFKIYIIKNGNDAGGDDDELNDCLFNSLKNIYPETVKTFKEPQDLKYFLKLKRGDKVGINHIQTLEKKINVGILITGDHIHSPTINTKQIIKIKLVDEHYSVDTNTNDWKPHGVSNYERQPIIYKKNGNVIKVYDGCSHKTISREEYKNLLLPYNHKRKVLIELDNCSFEDCYQQFVKKATALKIATDGELNMFKSGRAATTALNYFHQLSKTIQPELMHQDESEWIRNASMGAVIYGEEYEGEGYKYDVKSFYPSIMRDQKFSIPIKRGTFSILTNDEFHKKEFFSVGIYRCRIIGKNKFFRINSVNHHYTHYDLTTAKELGFKMEMIEDGKYNFLQYESTQKINGNKLFKTFVDNLYALKDKKVDGAKNILNCLWGVLVQERFYRYTINDDENFEIRSGNTLYSIKPCDDDEQKVEIEFRPQGNSFSTNYGRMKPFLLACGRRRIFQIIRNYQDEIVRIHTDGFISKSELDIKTGNEIGDLAYEGYCKKVFVKNSMKVKGEFMI